MIRIDSQPNRIESQDSNNIDPNWLKRFRSGMKFPNLVPNPIASSSSIFKPIQLVNPTQSDIFNSGWPNPWSPTLINSKYQKVWYTYYVLGHKYN